MADPSLAAEELNAIYLAFRERRERDSHKWSVRFFRITGLNPSTLFRGLLNLVMGIVTFSLATLLCLLGIAIIFYVVAIAMYARRFDSDFYLDFAKVLALAVSTCALIKLVARMRTKFGSTQQQLANSNLPYFLTEAFGAPNSNRLLLQDIWLLGIPSSEIGEAIYLEMRASTLRFVRSSLIFLSLISCIAVSAYVNKYDAWLVAVQVSLLFFNFGFLRFFSTSMGHQIRSLSISNPSSGPNGRESFSYFAVICFVSYCLTAVVVLIFAAVVVVMFASLRLSWNKSYFQTPSIAALLLVGLAGILSQKYQIWNPQFSSSKVAIRPGVTDDVEEVFRRCLEPECVSAPLCGCEANTLRR